jgi:hypothetical protein
MAHRREGSMMPDTEITEYGFRMGAATVERMAMIKGDAVIRLRTPKQEMTIRVTPSGLIRLEPITKRAESEK